MKPATFDYRRANDVADALRLLSEAGPDAKLMAGGQSLGPMLNLRLARPKLIVDISRIDRLRQIERHGEHWRIGALVTHARLEDAGAILGDNQTISRVAGGIAYRAIRNRGTIGGSLAHADPAADWPLALAALGADVVVRGISGARSVSASAFVKGAFTTSLGPDEMVETIIVPSLQPGVGFGYAKFCRKVGEFPEASAAVLLDRKQGIARVFVGALNGAPKALERLAPLLLEQGGQGACNKDSIEAALGETAPELDMVRRSIHTAIVAQAIRQVLQ